MSDNRPSVYQEGGRLVIRASAFGGCIRALVCARDGMDPIPFPASLQEAMDVSANLEQAVFDTLGDPVHSQHQEVGLRFGATTVRGHIDGIVRVGQKTLTLAEVKVFGDSYWDKWLKEGLDGFPRYQWQLSAYMLSLGLPGLMAIGHKQDGKLVDVRTLAVHTAPISLDQMAARVREVETAGELPVCNTDMWPCPYAYTHVDDTPRFEHDSLEALIRTYQRLREEEAVAKEERDGVRVAILTALKVLGQDKVLIGHWRVTRTVRTDTRVDMRQLRLVIDVAPYEKTSETEQLRVSELGEDDG